MNYEPIQFVGRVAGVTTTTVFKVTGQREAAHYEDTGDEVLSGIVRTSDGTKYNVNGTWQANKSPGTVRAVYLCRGSNMKAANDQADSLYDLAGASGTLYGIEYETTTVVTHTCAAVVVAARPISMMDRVGAVLNRAHAIQVEVIFDRTNSWT